MCNSTLRKYEVPTENVLALIVDNASNMTKTVERLNENDTSALPEETPSLLEEDDGDDDNELPSLVCIHHVRCAVHTLQLSIEDNLKQPHCNKLLTKTRHVVAKLRSPNAISLLEKREKKRPVLDTCTRWGSTYLMIKRLLELRNSIEELRVLSPEFYLSTGVFMKEWCSLKHTLRGKPTSLALEILRAMEKKEKSLFQNKLFLDGVFVDARYRILLSEEQVELAKAGLLEVAFKARHCSVRAFNVSDTADTSSESILVGDIPAPTILHLLLTKKMNSKKNWIYWNEENRLNTSLQAILLIRCARNEQ